MISHKSIKRTTTTSGSIELNAADIAELLRKAGVEIPASAVTSGMRVYFAVPGGGNWSNTDVDIDDKNPVRVEWQTTEERDA